MSERKQATMTILYSVRLRKTAKNRVILEIVRDGYCKQLGYYHRGQIKYASKKQRHFFDFEDEKCVVKEAKDPPRLVREGESLERLIGSVELHLFLHPGPRIEVCFVDLTPLGTWTPTAGLKLTKDAHPAFGGDKHFIAKICSELPQGGGGIFQGDSEETTV